jgi:hypothetical protein
VTILLFLSTGLYNRDYNPFRRVAETFAPPRPINTATHFSGERCHVRSFILQPPTTEASLQKPYPDFPLTAHPAGQLCKKIRGKLYYFGHMDDSDGALEVCEQRAIWSLDRIGDASRF